MDKKIDIISFCKILTDLTNKDKCTWRPTSHKSRDCLDFKSGYIEITLYQETENMSKCYCIDIHDKEDMQYIPFWAEKGNDMMRFEVFGDLYKSIWAYYERKRNAMIDSFYKEIMELTSK